MMGDSPHRACCTGKMPWSASRSLSDSGSEESGKSMARWEVLDSGLEGRGVGRSASHSALGCFSRGMTGESCHSSSGSSSSSSSSAEERLWGVYSSAVSYSSWVVSVGKERMEGRGGGSRG